MKTRARDLNLWVHPAYTLMDDRGAVVSENGLVVFSAEEKANRFNEMHKTGKPVNKHRDASLVWAALNRKDEEYCDVDPE